jgi:AraC-like DNA-binding protein
MRRLLSITSTAVVVLGGLTAEASELPAFEKFGFPITGVQVSVLGAGDVQESSPVPTLTLGGMPASHHQIAVLTPRPRIAEQARPAKLPRLQLDFDAWRDFLHLHGEWQTKVAKPNAFAAWLQPLSLWGLTALALKVECGSGTMDLRRDVCETKRTGQDVRRAGADVYSALFQLTGQSAVAQNDQAMHLAAGDVVLVDAGRPSAGHASSGEWLSVQLPRQSLVAHLGFEPKGGVGARSAAPAARLLFEVVRDAIEGDVSSSSAAGPYMQLAVYDLFAALFAPSDPLPVSSHAGKLFERVCNIIEDRFADPAFGPPDAAAEAGISLRYLQKLFTARNSTCTHFLLSVRLDQTARLLQRRALLSTRQPLCEIAYACGFTDYTNFARRFRNRFGHTPGAHAGDGA